MTGKDVYLQMTWSWPDKTWNILCSYCLQWNTSQSKFRNHYFLFLFAFLFYDQTFNNKNVWFVNYASHFSSPIVIEPVDLYQRLLDLWNSVRRVLSGRERGRDRERQTEKEGKGGEGRQAHTHPPFSSVLPPPASVRAYPHPHLPRAPGPNHVIDAQFTQDTLNTWTRSCFVTLGEVFSASA